MLMLLFNTVFTPKRDSSGRLKATQRKYSPLRVGLDRCHCESCGSPQDPLPKKWNLPSEIRLEWVSTTLGLKNTVSCPFTRGHLCVISASVRKKNDWLAIINQTRALSALMFRKLEASVSSATQTDPVAPRDSSLSITLRNKRDGS